LKSQATDGSPYRPFPPARYRLAISFTYCRTQIRPHRNPSRVRWLGFRVEPDRQDTLRRRDVVADRQISLRGYRDMIPASQFFLRSRSPIPTAHGEMIAARLCPINSLFEGLNRCTRLLFAALLGLISRGSQPNDLLDLNARVHLTFVNKLRITRKIENILIFQECGKMSGNRQNWNATC